MYKPRVNDAKILRADGHVSGAWVSANAKRELIRQMLTSFEPHEKPVALFRIVRIK